MIGKRILSERGHCILCEVQANIIYEDKQITCERDPMNSNVGLLGVPDIKVEIL